MRTAILGLGRSGLAAALGVRKLGGEPVVFDRSQREALAKSETGDRAEAERIDVVYGFDSVLPDGFETLIVNPAVDRRHPLLADAVVRGIEVIGEIEFAYRLAKAPIVAITGTNGKSTTTAMTYRCLEAVGERPILCGNIFGSGLPETTLTEAALEANADQTLVAEISSFQLEWVKEFRPAVAAITNITPDHLDRYEGFREYAATKMNIFAAQTAEDYAVIRANDPVVSLRDSGRTSRPPVQHVRTVGPFGEDAEFDEYFLRVLHRKIPMAQLPFSEPHNLANAGMAAILADSVLRWRAGREPSGRQARKLTDDLSALHLAIQEQRSVYQRRDALPPQAIAPEIVEALKAFPGLAHRMERVGEREGVLYVNNSMCTNPAAVVASLQALKRDSRVLIGGKNKGLDFTPLRQFLSTGRHKAYIYGSDGGDLADMLGDKGPVYASMDDAFAAAAAEVRPGEALILAPGCASTDGFRDFRHRGDRFRELAQEELGPETLQG